MISCEHVHNLFEAYLNDELSSSLTAELEAHRLKCPSCQQQLSLMEACGNVVRLDTSEPRVSEDFTDRLMAILDEHSRQPERGMSLRRGMKLAGGLLGLAASITLLVVYYPVETTPAPYREIEGATYQPEVTSSSDFITELPVERAFDFLERLPAIVELGQYLNGARGMNAELPLDALTDFPAYPPPPGDEPELEVIDTLPILDDGGELM